MTRPPRLLLAVCILSTAPAIAGELVATPAAAEHSFAADVAPFLAKHCASCHGGAKPKGGVSLKFVAQDEAAVAQDKALWEKVADTLRAGDMPPAHKARPTGPELDAVNRWLDTAVFHVDCKGSANAGRVTLHRLNRAEYNNTIRDLFGIRVRVADGFPSDDVGYGFDNIGDVLSMSPLLMEKYLAAAEKVVREAWKNEEARKRILVASLDEKADAAGRRKVIRGFTERAWRRPITEDETRRLLRLVDLAVRSGDKPEVGIQLVLRAVLASPNFLFRVELDPAPKKDAKTKQEDTKANSETAKEGDSRTEEAKAKPFAISDWELASRLSYFLWSSMPDDELFRLARSRELHDPAVLEAQTRRMLKDGKARALVDNFAFQWLQLRNLKSFFPDPGRFPKFNEALRSAMQDETQECFAYIVREDRSVLEMLSADYTFVNERLAKHYGIEGVEGLAFRKVSVAGSPRGGLLTQASVLAVTSNPTRTSPVKRGKWVLENLLGATIPPPPPGVQELKDDKPGAELTGTLRQRMEQHRTNASCAACHQRMDPLGFGLENFDAVGAWRTVDGKEPVDASGVLPGGQSFNGPAELKAVLLGRKDQFVHCLADKLLTYALGRGTERTDRCAVDAIARDLSAADYRFSALVLAIVRSEPFLKRMPKGIVKK
jgi:mono/diheme cytochrome c family protein